MGASADLLRRHRLTRGVVIVMSTLLVGLVGIEPAAAIGSISVGDVSTAEGTAVGTKSFSFPVTLSTSNILPVTVDWTASAGTASAGDDFVAASGTVTFVAGDTSEAILVQVVQDDVAEPNETFTVTLSNPSLGTTIADGTATATIQNDDGPIPSFSVDDETVTEGTGEGATATFTVSLSPAAEQETQVRVRTVAGSAGAPADFAAVDEVVSFAAGETSAPVTVDIVGDALDEANETYTLALSEASNAAITDASGAGTIDDDDEPPVISIAAGSGAEGDAGAAPIELDVTLSAPSGRTVVVDYATSGATATSGSDFSPASGTLTFDPGVTEQAVVVNALGDTRDEPDETFTVTLSNPTNGTLEDSPEVATGTITDDDDAPGISINNVAVAEGDAGTAQATFTVTLSAASGRTITVEAATGDGTAEAPGDYTADPGITLTFNPGDTSEPFTVDVIGDTLDEVNETFTVTLSDPSNATLTDATGVGTITDDDGAPILSITDDTVLEGDAGTATAEVTVSLSAPSGREVTVDLATGTPATATAGSDYTPVDTTVTFEPGDTEEVVPIDVLGDVVDEPHETFTVRLTSPTGAAIADATGAVTITDDDDGPTLAIADDAEVEGTGAGTTLLEFPVTLTGNDTQQTVTVDYTTVAGTATSPADYTAASGTLTFTAGETEETVTVTVSRDIAAEPNETFTVVLSAPTNATITDDTATGTITNDDGPAPTVSIVDSSAEEGGTITFEVTLSSPTTETVDVAYTTTDGTATAGSDYTATSGTVTFDPLDTTESFVVATTEDATDEPDETLTLTLSDPHNATITDGTATGTIDDDDPVPSISVDDESGLEGDANTSTITFTVELSNPSASEITVDAATSDGTADAGTDYTAVETTTVTFAPGETSKVVTVTVVGDVLDEPNETFTLTLTDPANATIADGVATGTITDDDPTPVASIDDVSVDEGSGAGTTTATFTVVLSAQSASTVTVEVDTSDGTAAAGDDYTAVSTTVSFQPGDTSETVSVAITRDTVDEADETFTITLTEPANATIGDGTATGTILDDDVTPAISVDDQAVTEGSGAGTTTLTFTITLSEAATGSVSVDAATSGGSATPNADYSPFDGTITFAPGDTSETVAVTIVRDSLAEANEILGLVLSSPSGGTIADSTGVGGITDDDPRGTFTSLTPATLADTRSGVGVSPGKLESGELVTIDVTGRGGVPATGASSVALSVVALEPTASGYLSVTSTGTPRQATVHFRAGARAQNLTVVSVGPGGGVRIQNSAGRTHVVVRAVGFYSTSTRQPPASHFTALTPARVVDSRTGLGVAAGRLGPGASRTIDITGVGGVPTGNVSAVAVNVRAIAPTTSGYLAVTHAGSTATHGSVTTRAGATTQNLVFTRVSTGGNIRVYNSSGTTHLVVDVVGFYSTPGRRTGATFRPVSAARLADSRTGLGVPQGKMATNETVTVDVTGRGGVPAANVSAVLLTVRALSPTASGSLCVTPNGSPKLGSVAFSTNRSTKDLVVVKVGAGGNVRIQNTAGQTHVVVDVIGYFTTA